MGARDDASAGIWTQVWSLYARESRVFDQAFRSLERRGAPRIDASSRNDLIHTFLLRRAAPALKTYQPTKGELGPWLFVVFRNYVLEQLRTEQRRRQLVSQMQAWNEGLQDPEKRHEEAASIRQVWSRIPHDERRALTVYYDTPVTSLSAAARSLGLTTWKTRRLLHAAQGRLQRELGVIVEDIPMVTIKPPTPVSPVSTVSSSIRPLRDQNAGLFAFLDDADPAMPSPEAARALLEQAAADPAAAVALSEHEQHAWLLLEATESRAEPSQAELDEVRAGQLALGVVARRVFARAPAELKQRLSAYPNTEQITDKLQLLAATAEPGELRAALAVSEAVLTVQGMLDTTRLLLAIEGDRVALRHIRSGTLENVPRNYMPGRIAEHAEIEESDAEWLWGLIARQLVEDSDFHTLDLNVAKLADGTWEISDPH